MKENAETPIINMYVVTDEGDEQQPIKDLLDKETETSPWEALLGDDTEIIHPINKGENQ